MAPEHKTQDTPAEGPRLRILEGTVIETVLLTRLNGTLAGPVACLVTTPVYSEDRQHVLIPAGARVLGSSAPVQSWGDSRLAVSFHRLVMPDGHTHTAWTDSMGSIRVGEAGVTEDVNRHYLQIFGASAAIGALSGLAQFGTTSGLASTSFEDQYRQAAGASLASSTSRILDRYLNVLPTITVREGYRVKVYLTADVDLPVGVSHPLLRVRRCPMTRHLTNVSRKPSRRASSSGIGRCRYRRSRLPAFRPPSLRAVAICALRLSAGSATTVRAQTLAVPVFDAATYSEAIIEAFDHLEQLANMYFQGQPLPVDMAARCIRSISPFWTTNSLFSPYPAAQPVLNSLNAGDALGNGYQQVVDPLQVPTDVLALMPTALQRVFADRYATIQLADSVAAMGINQSGVVRANGNEQLQVLQSMQADAFSRRSMRLSGRRPRSSTSSTARPC